MAHHRGDPRDLIARRPGRCAGCGVPFAAGAVTFAYPPARRSGDWRLYGPECGCADACRRDFNSLAADEAAYAGAR